MFKYLSVSLLGLVLLGAGCTTSTPSTSTTMPDQDSQTPPQREVPEGWLETETEGGVTFIYPEELSTTYIGTTEVAWPPIVKVVSEPYECDTDLPGQENGPPFTVEEKTLDGQEYCVQILHEGAAGSVYRNYIYRTEHKGELATVEFNLRYPQCGNYDDPEKTVCEDEQEVFDPDQLAKEIVDSIY